MRHLSRRLSFSVLGRIEGRRASESSTATPNKAEFTLTGYNRVRTTATSRSFDSASWSFVTRRRATEPLTSFPVIFDVATLPLDKPSYRLRDLETREEWLYFGLLKNGMGRELDFESRQFHCEIKLLLRLVKKRMLRVSSDSLNLFHCSMEYRMKRRNYSTMEFIW